MALVTFHVIVPCAVSMFSVLDLVTGQGSPLAQYKTGTRTHACPFQVGINFAHFLSALLNSPVHCCTAPYLQQADGDGPLTPAWAGGEARRRVNAGKEIKYCVFPTSLA